MEYNLVTNLKICPEIVSQIMNGNVNLLYYAHIPSAIVALLMGFFVISKSKTLLAKIFFVFSFLFFLWTALNLVAWISSNSKAIMFSWSLLGIMSSLFYVVSLYFIYVFIDKKDISFIKKIILGGIVLPIIILTPTRFNLSGFDSLYCYAKDNLFLNYIYVPQIIASIWIIFVIIHRYIKADSYNRKQIIPLAIGIVLFLLTFFGTGYIADNADSYLMYSIEIYGLFALVIFLGFLAYLIVKFKAFEIRMLAAEALVAALVILLFAEFFFIGVENPTVTILISVTILLSTVFGIWLINSVRNEVKRKEELQEMSTRLAMANDKLRQLDNAKSEFISIASHQLRTPLTAIKGFISLLLEGTYGEINVKARDAMNKVYVSNERLIDLVEDLLNVSRIESGRMEYAFAPTQVEDIIHELKDNLVFNARKKKLSLEIKLPEKLLPKVKADYAKMREVLSNLIENSIKYTDRGGVTVRAESGQFPITNNQFPNNNQISNDQKNKLQTDDCVRVIISDTGIGIPAEEMPYLFGKFSRGKDVKRLHATGTGLGLYVGKGIVEAHGGRIWAESEGAGKGSRFIVELPLA